MMAGQDIFINNAEVHFRVASGVVRAIDQVSVRFVAGKITGLIGESGCGKSILGLSILGLLPPYAHVTGDILYGGMHILSASRKELRALRGRNIGFIPQSPAESLNTVRRVGSQLDEALRLVEKNSERRWQRALDLLRGFGFGDPERIMRAYPFELSGGMQQRVLCAIGVCCSPNWVMADEPTKGLDKALCDQVRETLLSLRSFGVDSMLVITHDLDLAENLCDVIAIMYAGQIVEIGERVLENPRHPYTQAYLSALPRNGMRPIDGIPPAPWDEFPGCRFAPRCGYATGRCRMECPGAYTGASGMVRCFQYA